MHGVYNYVPDTNHVSRVHSVAAICVTFYGICNVISHVKLCTSTFAPSKVQYAFSAQCSSLISCFPGLLLGNCLNNSEMAPVVSIFTGIIFVVIFHISGISIARSLYFRIFSAYFLITFLSAEIVASI